MITLVALASCGGGGGGDGSSSGTTYTISASASPQQGGNITGQRIYDAGAAVILTANPVSGYTFSDWTENGAVISTSERYSFTATADRGLVAHFLPDRYDISASVNPLGSGTVTGAGTYSHGAGVTLTATPAANHAFVDWTEGGSEVSTSISYTFTVTTDRALAANFQLIDYAISAAASPSGGGAVAGAGTYTAGADATLTASAAAGYTFVDWTEGGTEVSTSPSYTFTVTGNLALVAHFLINSYVVGAAASPAGTGTIGGAGTYAYGASVTLTATPAAGYVFGSWSEDGNAVSRNSTYVFTAARNRQLTANFIPDVPGPVSGTIHVPPGTATDSDVNDPAASYSSNDSIATPQDIPDPVSVGGYANQPGTGPIGRSEVIGDTTDIYRVTLSGSETITLNIGDSTAGDLDLFLEDISGNLIDSSQGVGSTESLAVTTAGTYLIEVYAYSGASTYVLTIGQMTSGASTDPLGVGAPFVPGDVIVRYKDTPPAAGSVKTMALRVRSTGLAQRAGRPGGALLMHFAAGTNRASTFHALGIDTGGGRRPPVLITHAADPRIDAKEDTIRVLKALRRRKDVLYASPNYIRHPTAVPNDRLYPLQWDYPLINLPAAWDISTGSNVTIAVIDTGVLLSHPDLQGQLVPGYDFISSPAEALDGDGIDSNPDDPGDGGLGNASSFHGTHVAGTIAAATNDNIGVAGIAWNAKIMPLRALGKGGGTSYDIDQAVRYAAGLSNDSGTVPAQRADIINLSLGGAGHSQAEQDTFTQARNQGVIIVAAAGNDSSTTPSYPAAYDGVVSVSAVGINKALAPYSNFGPTIDVAAPGGDMSVDRNGDGYPDGVLSTHGDDSSGSIVMDYSFLQGTSMASPHVAGVIALMKSIDPSLTPTQFDTLLASGALTIDLGAAGRDDLYGYGLIDAYKAVVAAQGAAATPGTPAMSVSPGALNFGSVGTTATLSVVNSGGGTLTVNPPTDDASWLTVSAVSVDGNNLGTYQVAIDRSGLAGETYSATITFTSSENTVKVPVIMQVNGAVTGDAGRHYVLVIDPKTLQAVAQTPVDISNGVYNFSIPNVPAGDYQIFAGTDSNNNGSICDADEACGAYPSLDQPQTITVSGGAAGLDFTTGFAISISGQSASGGGSPRPGYRRIKLKNTALTR